MVRTPCAAATSAATAVSVDPSPYSAGPFSRMPWMATSAPRLASRSAKARPSPRPAPVTSATLPSSVRAASCVGMMSSPDVKGQSGPGSRRSQAVAGPYPVESALQSGRASIIKAPDLQPADSPSGDNKRGSKSRGIFQYAIVHQRQMAAEPIGQDHRRAQPGDRRNDRHRGACRPRRSRRGAGSRRQGFQGLARGGAVRALPDHAQGGRDHARAQRRDRAAADAWSRARRWPKPRWRPWPPPTSSSGSPRKPSAPMAG